MLKDKEKQKAYRRKYDLARYHKRRANAIAQLGGKCVKCGSEKELQIDHIDPAQKLLAVGKLWGVAEKRFQEELAKCQLLCQPCHSLKTTYDMGQLPRRCGSTTGYACGCRCGPCKKAHSDAWRIWYRKKTPLSSNGTESRLSSD
jgi:hypothetical protein